jgi:hypothetical protein
MKGVTTRGMESYLRRLAAPEGVTVERDNKAAKAMREHWRVTATGSEASDWMASLDGVFRHRGRLVSEGRHGSKPVGVGGGMNALQAGNRRAASVLSGGGT